MWLVRRYWGYGLVLLLLLLIGNGAGPAVVFVIATACAGYFLFQVPVWCAAETRNGMLCRNNSRGLLFGCHYRQHKWQVFKMAVVPHGLRQLQQAYWATPSQGIATLGALASLIAALTALAALILNLG